jgi:AcrR family transcriptional regulator
LVTRPDANLSRVPPKNTERARARRKEIIQAAMELFAHTGWPVATADEIAAAAGVTKRTLYTYFGSKRTLLREVGDELIETSREGVRSLTLDGDAEDRLRVAITSYLELVVAWKDQYLVFLEEMKHLDDSAMANVRAISAEWVTLMRSVVEAGQQSGDFDATRDPTVAAQTILAMLNGMTYWVHPDGGASQAELSEQTFALVLGGLAIRPQAAK